MEEKKKYVFVVGTYDGKNGETLTDYCQIEIFCNTAKEALDRAKELIDKNYYEITRILEIKEEQEKI